MLCQNVYCIDVGHLKRVSPSWFVCYFHYTFYVFMIPKPGKLH